MRSSASADLTGARLIGVVMQDAVIDGLVTNLVVNGVEVTRVRRGGARPASSGAGADPLRRPGRPARGLASARRRLGRDRRAAPRRRRGHRAPAGRTTSGRRSRRCATWSSSTTRGSAAAASARPTLFTPMGLGIESVARPRGAGARPLGRRRASTRCERCATQQAAELEAWLADGHRRRSSSSPAPVPDDDRLAAVRPGPDGAAVPAHRAQRGASSTTASACATSAPGLDPARPPARP